MNTRRTTLALGAAAGGLMAATFLSTAVAFAQTDPTPVAPVIDLFGFSPIDGSPENVIAISGIPPLDQQVEGSQVLDFFTTASGATTPTLEGTVDTDVSTLTFPGGFTNTEYLVTGGTPADFGPPAAGGDDVFGVIPTQGSVFDVANYGGGFENVYESLVGAGTGGANTVTDTLVTPFGNFDLSSLFGGFDASVTGVNFTDLASLDNADFLSAVGAIQDAITGFSPALGADFATITSELVTAFGF